jgi:hypothetical protein
MTLVTSGIIKHRNGLILIFIDLNQPNWTSIITLSLTIKELKSPCYLNKNSFAV